MEFKNMDNKLETNIYELDACKLSDRNGFYGGDRQEVKREF